MNVRQFFAGEKVNLVPLDLEKELKYWEEWDLDSEYKRLLDDSPAAPIAGSVAKEQFEENNGSGALFMVHAAADDRVIGFIELSGFDWAARSGWVGIGIGDAEYRGKGFGTEAMQLVLDYAFRGLNLNRVNLNVFAYNKRAICSYEKCGFRYEGTQREVIFKEDQRWDVIDMGILRTEWESLQHLPDE
ncbi:MAG: GNAT family protein [Anaerolineaceae bacterium]